MTEQRIVYWRGHRVGSVFDYINGRSALCLHRPVETLGQGVAWEGPRTTFRWLCTFLNLEVVDESFLRG